MLRCRMRKIIRLLERNDFDSVKDVILSDKYRPALRALSDERCVEVLRGNDGKTTKVWLLDHYATYRLSRQEIWINRLWGFASGVATTLAAQYLINVSGL